MGNQVPKLVSGVKMENQTERFPYKCEENNGWIIKGCNIPEEVFTKIFLLLEPKALLECQLVCKNWQDLIQGYIWRKKAEITLGHVLPPIDDDDEIPWTSYCRISTRKLFGRNLIKNHSGKDFNKRAKNFKSWHVLDQGGDKWSMECPPIGVPDLPEDPVFEGQNCCFVTSYGRCVKRQYIDLKKEGFTEYLLDEVRPTIKVSEWYCARWDCGGIYQCVVRLEKQDMDEQEPKTYFKEACNFEDRVQGERQNQWLQFVHEIKDYGPGLRGISFLHAGQDTQFWAGHYGIKMAGSCIKFEWPKSE